MPNEAGRHASPASRDCPASCALTSVPVVAADGSRVDRRQFLSRAAVSAALLALAGCGALDSTAPFSGPYTLTLADYPALASVGGVALVNANGAALAVVRTTATTYMALSRTCPHAGAIVNATGGGFTCPRHGAQFALDGSWQGGQRTSGLASYATAYNASAGTLTIG